MVKLIQALFGGSRSRLGSAGFVAALGMLGLAPVSDGAGNIFVERELVLSRTGSTRATAYGMSHKIVDFGDWLAVGWLDQPAKILVARVDAGLELAEPPVLLGTGMSNHAGPALTRDGEGRLHAVFGPHHGPFTYRHSHEPRDLTAWSNPVSFGNTATYPSLVCAPDDVLHLAYRSSGTDPWRVLYQRKPPGGSWTAEQPLFENDVLDYMWSGNSLAVDGRGGLHLVYCLYEQEACRGRAIGYLRSTDGGRSWAAGDGRAVDLPTHAGSPATILAEPGMDVRVKSAVIGPDGRPWFVTVHLARQPRTVVLRSQTADGGWRALDLLPHLEARFPDRELVDATLAFDRDGRLYVFATTGARAPDATFWGHPSNEVVLLASSDGGRSFQVLPISTPDPTQPSWMPSIERPAGTEPIDTPYLLYTTGGPGEGVHGGPNTTVRLVKLSWK